MGVMIEKTCRTCGHQVYIEQDEDRGLGKPYARCTNCKSMILLGTRNEWQLQTTTQRALYVLDKCAQALLLPLLLVALVGLAFWISTVNFALNWMSLTLTASAAYLIAFALLLVPAVSRIKDEIRRSRRRMLNADYRAKLKHMGLWKDTDDPEAHRDANAPKRSRSRRAIASRRTGGG